MSHRTVGGDRMRSRDGVGWVGHRPESHQSATRSRARRFDRPRTHDHRSLTGCKRAVQSSMSRAFIHHVTMSIHSTDCLFGALPIRRQEAQTVSSAREPMTNVFTLRKADSVAASQARRRLPSLSSSSADADRVDLGAGMMAASGFADLVARVAAIYRQTPSAVLYLTQVAGLLGIFDGTCADVMLLLVRQRLLRCTGRGDMCFGNSVATRGTEFWPQQRTSTNSTDEAGGEALIRGDQSASRRGHGRGVVLPHNT